MQLNKIKRPFSAVVEWGSLLLSTGIVCLFLFIILWEIFSKGASVLSWDFVSTLPKEAMTKGGILSPIIGTVLLTLITALFAIPFGVCCAVYLNEYAQNTWLTRIIRAAIRNLSGVPSIIYGLFGLALFVQALNLGDIHAGCRFDPGLAVPALYYYHDRRSIDEDTEQHQGSGSGYRRHQV